MSLFKRRRIISIGTILLIVAAGAAWYWWPSTNETVRKIGVSIRPAVSWTEPGSVTVFHSAEELRAVFPGAKVQPERPVDFQREALVRVVWQSAGVLANGPAPGSSLSEQVVFDALQCCGRMAGRRIIFYLQKPQQYGAVREVFQQVVGEQWFVVPNDAQVAFLSPWIITLYDGIFLLISTVLIGTIVVLIRRGMDCRKHTLLR